MKWEKFYPLWCAQIGRIDRELLGVWKSFADSVEQDEILEEAIETLAEWYAVNRERDSWTPMPNLWQLKRSYRAIMEKKAKFRRDLPCGFCENSRTVIVLDNGKYHTDQFPADPAQFTGKHRCTASVPCPVCRAGEYALPGMRERVKRFCLPPSRRSEFFYRSSGRGNIPENKAENVVTPVSSPCK